MDGSLKDNETNIEVTSSSNPALETEPAVVDADVPTTTIESEAPQSDEESAAIVPQASADEASQPENSPFAVPITKPSRKKWIIIAIIIAAVLIIGGLVAWFMTRNTDDISNDSVVTKQSTQAKLLGVAPLLVEGSAQYSSNGKTWKTLTTTVSLKQGDSVKTGSDGRVVLAVDDGSAVRLNHNSQVKLVNMAATTIKIENVSGQLYSRVVPSTTRTFSVLAANSSYIAQGTAYCVTNSTEEQGVEVYHSSVKVGTQTVTEGNSYYVKKAQKDQQNKIVAIDLTLMKQNEFVKWNAEQDKKVTEYADKLGILSEFDKTTATTTTTTTQTTNTAANGIVLSGSVADYTAKMAWSVTNVDTSKGFKIVYSTKTTTPVYPGNDYSYVENSTARSATVKPESGKTYYFRVCAYRGSSCDSYSNTVTIVIPAKDKASTEDQLVAGALVLTINGSTASWTVGGTAPKGFKVVASTTKTAPEYPTDGYKAYTQETSVDLSTILSSGTWNVRVCKYTGSGCTDYSNTIVYTKS